MTILRRLLPVGLFAGLSCLFLWKVVFAGQVFVPAQLLRYLAPWTAEPRPPWNPLMYDSVGQFYPWRHFAAETVRNGTIPLWNPYQFCGTPFVANSQSAVFYPGNLLFYLLPTAQAAGWGVILHLTLAGSFTCLFLRGVGLSRPSAALGGIVYCFSTWQVSWLHLPTFLATSCWLPLVLHFTLRLRREPSVRSACLLALSVGMTLLAGHLQIAFYVLLAAALLAIWPKAAAVPSSTHAATASRRGAALWLVAVVAGGLLALPQVLPSLELSRQSHRVAPASAQGYEAYTAYAVSPASLVTLFLPDFYGNPSNPETPYVGTSRGGALFNYAEGAIYVGVTTLLLAAIGVLEARRRSAAVGYATALAGLAILMALGTFVDWLLYFYVPGFSQSGSPGRALVLWAFALSVLAAFGCEEVVSGRLCIRGLAGSFILVLLVAALSLAAGLMGAKEGGVAWVAGALIAARLLLVTCAASFLIARQISRGRAPRMLATVLPLLVLVDLFGTGIAYNPTSAPDEVYPKTSLITTLQGRAGHDRILPVNPRNFPFSGPNAVLPPNGAMVFGLRDVQGYDSLFPGQYKAFLDRIAEPVDPRYKSSPPEVGNMVFAKNPSSPLVPATGTRFIVSREGLALPNSSYVEGLYVYELTGAPGRAHAEGAAVRWVKDEPTRAEIDVDASAPTTLSLADEVYPGWHAFVDGQTVSIQRAEEVFRQVAVPAGSHRVVFEFRPSSFRVGLYLALTALASCLGCLIAFRRVRLSGAT